MVVPKTIEGLEKLISDKVEESLQLEYKDAGALKHGDKEKKEIAKDVSAMANSAGGVIIYGIKEYDDPDRKHLPEKITPIDRTQFSRESLEQILSSNISPRIEGLLIHPVALDQPSEAAYVVEIPQSNTAHQNIADGRYYRRHNFESRWMLDYEVRDIMNRSKHPIMMLEFIIERSVHEVKRDPLFSVPPFMSERESKEKKYRTVVILRIYPKNVGTVFAQYVNYYVRIPDDVVDMERSRQFKKPTSGVVEIYGENTYRDVVDYHGGFPKFGPSRFDPILPTLRGRSEGVILVLNPTLDDREITWTVYADNAAPRSGLIKLNEIQIVELDEEE